MKDKICGNCRHWTNVNKDDDPIGSRETYKRNGPVAHGWCYRKPPELYGHPQTVTQRTEHGTVSMETFPAHPRAESHDTCSEYQALWVKWVKWVLVPIWGGLIVAKDIFWLTGKFWELFQ